MKISKRNCPICECKISEKLFDVRINIEKTLGLPSEYDVVCCEYCGFCFADTEATHEDYENYYKNSNYYGEIPREKEEYQYLFQLVKEQLENTIEKDAYLLDIGFGKGELDVYLFNNGYKNICGIDPSEESVRHLNQSGIIANVGSVYDCPEKSIENKYKVVFMFNIFEHLYSPYLAIEQIKRYLDQNGFLYLWLPIFDDLKDDTTQIVNNFNQEHINYFSQTSLKNLMELNGFVEIHSKQAIAAKLGQSKTYGLLAIYQYDVYKNSIKINRDINTKKSILDYYGRVNQKTIKTIGKIKKLLNNNKKIVIWGTGAFVMNLLAITDLKYCNIDYFVDNNPLKIGKEFQGKNIESPEKLRIFEGTIVVCAMLYSHDIEKQIIDMKLNNEVIILE